MEKQKKIKRCASDRVLITIFYILVAIFAIVCLYPLLLAIGTSFADEASVTVNGYRVIPKKFSLSAYQMILGSMGKNLLNAYTVTIGVTVFGTLLSVLISAAFAYVLTVREFKPKGALNMFLYIPMIFSAGLLPWYIMCTKYYHLTDSFLALVLPCCMNAFNVFLLRNFFKSIPEELAEAAKIDGATNRQLLRHVTIPMVMPSITICTFLTLTNSFKLFDQNLALTAGEPANSSELLALNIFNTFYGRNGWEGVGQAKAVIFFIIVGVIALIQNKLTTSKEVQQ